MHSHLVIPLLVVLVVGAGAGAIAGAGVAWGLWLLVWAPYGGVP